MNFKLKIKNYTEKLQSLPENRKKIILWVVVGVVAIILLFVWVNIATKRFAAIEENLQTIQFSEIENSEIQNILENANSKNIKTEDKLLPNN